MHEGVRSSFHTRFLGSSRRPSFAGNGLPERMRSTAFAFLGLTAATGLALVAIFAQLSFPLLSPAPMPSGPAEGNAVSDAVALDHSPGVFDRANPGLASSGERDAGGASGRGGGGRTAGPTAEAPPEPGGGTSGGEAVETPSSAPSPASPPASEPAPVPAAAPDPAPAPKPAPTPARPAAPTNPSAPGNSQSSAAASHASERGVEASSKSPPESTGSGVATSGTGPAPEDSPGNGNGKALGHSK